MPWPHFYFKKALYRLPAYILLPTSSIYFVMDQLLYNSAGGDESIYTDSTIRLGMQPGFQLLILALGIGSILLLIAAFSFVADSFKEKRVDLPNLSFILLGLFFHPWVAGIVFDLLLR